MKSGGGDSGTVDLRKRGSGLAAPPQLPTQHTMQHSACAPLLLAQSGQDAITLQLGQVFDENLALEVIHLVLDANGDQTIGFDLERLAVSVESAYPYPFGSLNFIVDSGDGETTFFQTRSAPMLYDFGIDEHLQLVVRGGDIDDDHLLVDVDLGCRKSDARRGVHRFCHILNERPDRSIDLGDRRSNFV